MVMTPEFEARLIASIGALRPWWCWFNPWAYSMVLEGYLRDVLTALEDERDTIVSIHYPR